MPQSPAISIIIPVYNAEASLRRCIDSLLAQSFGDFELIAVDDGSSDRSAGIVSAYAADDNRVRLLTPGHGGVSAARNCGIDTARGTWLTFVDSDDYVAPDYLERLISGCEDTDFAISAYSVVNPGESPRAVNVLAGELLTDRNGNCALPALMAAFRADALGFVWGKLFRRESLDSDCLRFESDITFGEDGIFCFSYLRHVRNCHVSLNPGYFYVRSADNSSLAMSAPASVRLAGLERFWEIIMSKGFENLSVRKKMEVYCLDGLLAAITADRLSAQPSFSADDRYGCYDKIRQRLLPSSYRPYVPFFFDFCGRFHWWRLYERLYKLIYL